MHKLQFYTAIFLSVVGFAHAAAILDARRPPPDQDICTGSTRFCNNACCPISGHWCSPTQGCLKGSPPPPPPPSIWLTYYTIPPNCHDGVCSSTSIDDIPRIEVHGNNFRSSTVSVYIKRYDDGKLVWSGNGQAALDIKTGVINCPSTTGPPTKRAYVQAYDSSRNTWSNKVDVYVGCLVL